MRVTEQMMFRNYIGNMNSTLSNLMELNIQASTQKKVNKPSDDPTGMIRILGHRDNLRSYDQYKENIDTAKGWLGLSDENLLQISTILTRAKTLAQQASTGSLSEDNREQISYEIRSLFEQVLGLSNAQFEGKSLYAGQKTDQPAFREVLWLTSNDRDFSAGTNFQIDGSADHTILVQFYDKSGASDTGDPMSLSNANIGVRYTVDGGRTFLSDGSVSIAGGQAFVNLPRSGARITFDNPAAQVKITADPANAEGTWLWIRPTAQYIGDDMNDTGQVAVQGIGAGTESLSAMAAGNFGQNVTVRVDGYLSNGSLVRGPATMGSQTVVYSYSFDGGINWITGNVQPPVGVASNISLSIAPSGLLTISSNGSNVIQPGAQFFIHARAADIEINISRTETVRLNEVGMNVFGGVYMDPDKQLAGGSNRLALNSGDADVAFQLGSGDTTTIFVTSNSQMTSRNLFEVLGNLVGFLETNTQSGIQRCLASLTEAQSHIMNIAASVGGRENRLEVSSTIIEGQELNEKARLSNVEDVDITELMTNISQQQIVYEAVLRSSSMIMKMSLMNYL